MDTFNGDLDVEHEVQITPKACARNWRWMPFLIGAIVVLALNRLVDIWPHSYRWEVGGGEARIAPAADSVPRCPPTRAYGRGAQCCEFKPRMWPTALSAEDHQRYNCAACTTGRECRNAEFVIPMRPMRMAWHRNVSDTTMRYVHPHCDVPCHYAREYSVRLDGVIQIVHALDMPESVKETTIRGSQEALHFYSDLRDHKGHLALAHVDMESAEVPFSYYNYYTNYRLHEDRSLPWDIQTPQPTGQKPYILAVISNCGSKNKREQWVRELGKLVHSVGSCEHNFDAGKNFDKNVLMRQYKFTAAFENGCSKGYVTEKFWGPLRFGSVPIYLGAPDVSDLVPRGSYINALDFADGKQLGAYIQYLLANETAYNEYHAYRTKPLPTWFVDKYYFTKYDTWCRQCKFAAAVRDGHKWDRFWQVIRPAE